jgi:hypothetical protein
MSDPRQGGEHQDQSDTTTRDRSLDAELAGAVCGILLDSLRALADAGEVETACRLAGRACVKLRHSQPALARRFDVLLHRLTPRLTWTQPPTLLQAPDPRS